jgi:GR25 family glycosyltransferase involved in LPS biosynthesis
MAASVLPNLLEVDKVYCISLHTDSKKKSDIQARFSESGLGHVEFLPAIDGLSLKDRNDLPLGIWQEYILRTSSVRKTHEHFGSWGGLGCYLSHVWAWTLGLRHGFSKIMILEDDVVFDIESMKKLPELLADLPSDYDILVFDPLQTEVRRKVSEKISVPQWFWGFHAYVMSVSCVPFLLRRAFPVEMHVDHFIYMAARVLNLNIYVLRANICGQLQHESSVNSPIGSPGCTSERRLVVLLVAALIVMCLLAVKTVVTF